jgi:two-component system, LuxR family, response regulator FixJ
LEFIKEFPSILLDLEPLTHLITAATNISIVDDDDSMRHAIRTLVETEGRRVEEFCSAEEFLRSGRVEHTACLILDVGLPGIGGLELQAQLAVTNRRIPVIMISGHGNHGERRRALGAGAIDFLEKPFTVEALSTAVQRALAVPRAVAFLSLRDSCEPAY